MRKLIDFDPFTGTATFHTYNPLTKKTEIETQYADANTDASRARQNDPDYWAQGVKKDMVHYAHIPNSLLAKWAAEGVNIRDTKALFAKVNSSDFAHLKTTTKVHIARG